eukprot:gene28675-34620_t
MGKRGKQVVISNISKERSNPRKRPDSTSTVLFFYNTPWYQDDLPNILGINPIEASIIFGALYYFYGPNVLYEYARGAGKLFATYAPIIQQVSTDIFYEFRDYFEEDREREALRKAGIDISKMPRRTSNLIERVQESFSTLTEAAASTEGTGKLVSGDGNEVVVIDRSNLDAGRKRRKKKEVLSVGESSIVASNDQIDDQSAPIASSAVTNNPDELASPSLASPSLASPSEASTSPREDAYERPPSPASFEEIVVKSRFQQQLSGEWNQRVLRAEKYGGAGLGAGLGSMTSASPDAQPPPAVAVAAALPLALLPSESEEEVRREYEAVAAEFSALDDWQATPSTPLDVTASPEPAIVLPPVPVSTANLTMSDARTQAGLQFLQELDRDYLQLRSKVLSFIAGNYVGNGADGGSRSVDVE